jgi:hypothetical protein
MIKSVMDCAVYARISGNENLLKTREIQNVNLCNFALGNRESFLP